MHDWIFIELCEKDLLTIGNRNTLLREVHNVLKLETVLLKIYIYRLINFRSNLIEPRYKD